MIRRASSRNPRRRWQFERTPFCRQHLIVYERKLAADSMWDDKMRLQSVTLEICHFMYIDQFLDCRTIRGDDGDGSQRS